MKDTILRSRPLGPAALLMAGWMGILGCEQAATGPDPNPDPVPDIGFDAVATAGAVDQATTRPDGSDGLIVQLQLAGQALAAMDGSASVGLAGDARPSALDPVLRGSAPFFDRVALHTLTRHARGAGLRLDVVGLEVAETVFPPFVLGKILVWDPVDGSYIVDPDLSGAPASGVRFLLYEVDPTTGLPAIPLTVLGHLDLTDESDGITRLGVRAVDTTGGTERTLLDYRLEGSTSTVQGEIVVEVGAAGFVSDGAGRMEFSLAEEIAIGPDFESVRFSILDQVAAPDEDVSVSLELSGETAGEGASASLGLTIEDGPDTILFTVTAADESQEGSVKVNGTPVMLIGGSPSQPIFTRLDGGPLTQAQVDALRRIWESIDNIFAVAEQLLSPLTDLLGLDT